MLNRLNKKYLLIQIDHSCQCPTLDQGKSPLSRILSNYHHQNQKWSLRHLQLHRGIQHSCALL